MKKLVLNALHMTVLWLLWKSETFSDVVEEFVSVFDKDHAEGLPEDSQEKFTIEIPDDQMDENLETLKDAAENAGTDDKPTKEEIEALKIAFENAPAAEPKEPAAEEPAEGIKEPAAEEPK